MECILTHPSLVQCLDNLTIRSPRTEMKLWLQQKRAHTRITSLIRSLGKPSLTTGQAIRMDTLGLGVAELGELRDMHSKDDFLSSLKDKGVNSKVLREKILKALNKLTSTTSQVFCINCFIVLLFHLDGSKKS